MTTMVAERQLTVFEKGAPGRRAFVAPALDVPEADPRALLPDALRRSEPADATALGPSYTEALATGSAVSSEIAVWYSNITCSVPCETSGWYGV